LRESNKSRSKQTKSPDSPKGASSIVSWDEFEGETVGNSHDYFRLRRHSLVRFIILVMKTQRQHLFELIDKVTDDRLADAIFSLERLTQDAIDFKARLRSKTFEVRERVKQSLQNVPEVAGSRPDLSGGESWTFNEKEEAVDPYFALHWYEDDGATHVQKQRWIFHGQGFLTLLRTSMSADGGWYVLSLEIAGPGRLAAHEERFPASGLEA
jgi:hypothetical protein